MFAFKNTITPLKASSGRFFSLSAAKFAVKEVTEPAQFKKEVVGNSKVSLVDFYATWCGPCKAMAPIIDKFSDSYENVDFYKVDVDNVSDVAVEYGVTAMPTFVVFKDGEVFHKVIGANPKGVQQIIDAALKE